MKFFKQILAFFRQKLAREHKEAFTFDMTMEEYEYFCPRANNDFNADAKFKDGQPIEDGFLGVVGMYMSTCAASMPAPTADPPSSPTI